MIFDVDPEKGVRRALIEGDPKDNKAKREENRDIKLAEALIRTVDPTIPRRRLAEIAVGKAIPADLAESMFKGMDMLARTVDRADSETPLPVYSPDASAADLVVLFHHARTVVTAEEQAYQERAAASDRY